MTQADPWDETRRLQKQMEVELLAKPDGSSGPAGSKAGAQTEDAPSKTFEAPAPKADR